MDAIWQKLLDRAGSRPGLPLTDDPDLHLLVDGVRLDASARSADACIFCLPAATARSIRILSRASVPNEIGIARDPRQLGVALRKIVLRRGTKFQEIELTNPALLSGFHKFEMQERIRWTDGDALFPMSLMGAIEGAEELVLQMGGSTLYIDEGDRQLVA